MRATIVLVTLGLLVGCASKKPWIREGSTQEQFEQESAQCRVLHAQVQTSARTGIDALAGANIYTDCMRGKGWKK